MCPRKRQLSQNAVASVPAEKDRFDTAGSNLPDGDAPGVLRRPGAGKRAGSPDQEPGGALPPQLQPGLRGAAGGPQRGTQRLVRRQIRHLLPPAAAGHAGQAAARDAEPAKP